jgi:hypothetical protein
VYVSVTRTKASPEQPPELATIAGEEMLPWLRQIDGFEGLLLLTSEELQTTMSLVFWRDRDVAEQHRAARAAFRERVAAALDVTVEETAGYELSFVELGPRLSELRS